MKARTAEQFIHDLAEMSLETLREQYVILGETHAEEESAHGRVLLELMSRLVRTVIALRFDGADPIPEESNQDAVAPEVRGLS